MSTYFADQSAIHIAELYEEDVQSEPAPAQETSQRNLKIWLRDARTQGLPFLKSELRTNRRVQLGATACAVALLATIGGFTVLGLHHAAPVTHTLPIDTPQPVASTAAKLARAQSPTRSSAPAARPSPSGGDDMAEFIRLQSGQTDAQPPAPQAAPSSRNQPPTAPVTPVTEKTPAVTTPATPPAPTKHRTADPLTVTASLHPETMSDQSQVQVLELVTQLGTMIRDQRTEISELRAKQKALQTKVDEDSAEFRRRLALTEARQAIGAALAPPATDDPTHAAPPQSDSAASPAPPPPQKTENKTATANTTPHRYHIQAASPGLAMVSELDASGGELRQIPISPGDNLPGWGKVTAISQHGTAWLIKTDHGVIQ